MNKLAFQDETLDLNLTKTYHISIQASLNGFSFCILDSVQNKYVALKHYPIKNSLPIDDWIQEIEKILKGDEFMQQEYRSVSVMEVSSKATLIPKPLFDESKLKLFLEFNTFIDDLDEIHFNELKNEEAFNVFTINTYLASSIKKRFPKAKFFHQSSPFIQHFGDKQNTNREGVFVNINSDFIDVLAYGKGKLLLSTSMPFRKEGEILYLILNIFQQLHLSREHFHVHLSGNIQKKNELVQELEKYIAHVRIAKQSDAFSYSYTFNSVEKQWFLNLLNLYKCE